MERTKDMAMDQRQRSEEVANTSTGVSLTPKKLIALDKATIVSNAKAIVNAVQDGDLDLVDTFIEVKKGKLFFETLEENLKGFVYGKSLVAKGAILKMHSVEIEQSELGVVWDYKGCCDVILDRLNERMISAAAAVKERQAYLQVITTISKQVDMETGEEYTVNPPVRKATNGYKFSIK